MRTLKNTKIIEREAPRSPMRWPMRLSLVPLALLLTVFAGCSEPEVQTVRVKGLITLDGEAPPTTGKVYFAPYEVAPGLPRRPGTGEFDTEGNFVLTTFEEGDGLIPGKYRVNVECWREPPTLQTKWSANFVPPDFHPEYEILIGAEEPVEIKIDAPVQSK